MYNVLRTNDYCAALFENVVLFEKMRPLRCPMRLA